MAEGFDNPSYEAHGDTEEFINPNYESADIGHDTAEDTAIEMNNVQVHDMEGGAKEPVKLADVVREKSVRQSKKGNRIDHNSVLFPDDPTKKIDFVIDYKDPEGDEADDIIGKRERFEANLRSEGLELDIQDKNESIDGESYYILIHATWKALANGAGLINMKKRLKSVKKLTKGEEEKEPLCHCVNAFEVSEEIVPEEDDFFTAAFNQNRLDMFEIDLDDRDKFFTDSERTLIVKSILDRTAFSHPNAEEIRFGITKLIRDEVYLSAYPLHDGPYRPPEDDPHPFQGPNKDRIRLFEAWARPGRWYCYQPLDLIRRYFGEKIGIYFGWLGFYTTMLVPAAILGLIAFIYGCASLTSDEPSNDVCDEDKMGNTIMCPLCDERCDYWLLKDSCIYSKLTYLFDNYASVAFAAFMAIWSTVFLEFWKRQQKELEYEWDVADFELEERMRPEYEFKVKRTKENPITQLKEPHMSFFGSVLRAFTAYSAVLFMICLVLAAIFGVIIYRIIVVVLMYTVDQDQVSANAKIITSLTAAVINLLVIMILNQVYRLLAGWLTDYEMHRTETEYEDSFTFKMFLFQFVNFYGSIFYIAFFKGRFIPRPGETKWYLFDKYKQDECDPAGCLIELCIQLAIVMVGKQAINNFKELFLPLIMKFCKTRASKKLVTEDKQYLRWEQDEDLPQLPKLALFDEYLEMVVQFGFITVFVAAFPLAPFFALLNNVIEIRLDAWKFVVLWRRPVAMKAQDIGVWFGILQMLAFLSVLSNAFIIAFSSNFIPQLVYRYIYADENNLKGFLNDSLSYFKTEDYLPSQEPDEDVFSNNGTTPTTWCRYRDYRYSPKNGNDPEHLDYEYTLQYWHVFTARLAFVIVFEHIAFLATAMVAYVIPDVPHSVKRLMLHEKQLVKKLNFDFAFKHAHDKKEE